MKDPDDISIEDFRAAFGPDPWGERRRERQHCHMCGERYLLENLEDCAGCKDYTCPSCANWRKNPSTGETECVCGACLEYKAGWWNEGKPSKTLNSNLSR